MNREKRNTTFIEELREKTYGMEPWIGISAFLWSLHKPVRVCIMWIIYRNIVHWEMSYFACFGTPRKRHPSTHSLLSPKLSVSDSPTAQICFITKQFKCPKDTWKQQDRCATEFTMQKKGVILTCLHSKRASLLLRIGTCSGGMN